MFGHYLDSFQYFARVVASNFLHSKHFIFPLTPSLIPLAHEPPEIGFS